MLLVCNGMIRSGSTLQYNMIRELVEKHRLGKGQGFYTKNNINTSKNLVQKWKDDQLFHVIKMHDLYDIDLYKKAGESMRIIYIYRDIRDVAVSVKRKFGHTDNTLIDVLDEAVAVSYELNKYDNVLTQRYEDVISNISYALNEQTNFLKISANKVILDEIKNNCSLENMILKTRNIQKDWKVVFKKQIMKIGFRKNHIYDNKTLLHPDHVSENRGAVGLWRKALTGYEISILTDRYNQWLNEHNYPLY